MTDTIDPTPWIQWGGAIFAVLAFAAALVVPRLLRAQKGAPVAAPVEPRDEWPVCQYCDAPARRPPSHFAGSEGFGAEMRVRFGAAQNYTPKIATDEPPALCPAHARTWDALLSEKATTTIARERAEAEVRIAREMAAFESEGINASMLASITDVQRTALRKRKKSGETEGG